jgi:hypothetical protein
LQRRERIESCCSFAETGIGYGQASINARPMPMQRTHDAETSEPRRLVMFRNEKKRLHCGLPFIGFVFRLGQFGDVFCGVAQGDKRLAARQLNRIEKLLIPRHPPRAYASRNVS